VDLAEKELNLIISLKSGAFLHYWCNYRLLNAGCPLRCDTISLGVKCLGFFHLCLKVHWRTTVKTTNTFFAHKKRNYMQVT